MREQPTPVGPSEKAESAKVANRSTASSRTGPDIPGALSPLTPGSMLRLQRSAGNRVVASMRAAPRIAQRVDNYTGPTVGVEQELDSGQKVVIPNPKDRGRLGSVLKNGQVLVEFTSDVGGHQNEYTIELKTTPTVKDGAANSVSTGVAERQEALRIMVGAILRAGARKGPVASGTYGDYTIVIDNPNHSIQLAGRPSTHENAASESVTFANQASLGVRTQDLSGAATADIALILQESKWYEAGLEADLPVQQGMQNLPGARRIYALVASTIAFLAKLVAEAPDLVKVNDDGEIEGDLYNSTLKDKWGVLPRTPVWDWLDVLPPPDKGFVQTALREKYNNGTTKPAYNHISNKLALAGHKIPDSTIGNTAASVFEFRGVPQALEKYLYQSEGGEWQVSADISAREAAVAEEWARNKPQSALAKKIAAVVSNLKVENANPDVDDDEWK